MTIKANGKPRQRATFTTWAKDEPKEKIIIEVYNENMTLDKELLQLIAKYLIIHGGLHWEYEQE